MNTIFIDMDGVVADFDAYAVRVLDMPLPEGRWPRHLWAQIASNPRIYSKLPKTAEADDLINFCRSAREVKNYELLFLTAVPKGNDVHWAFYDKVNWGLEHFSDIPVHFGPFAKNKHEHCKPGDILIDDKPENIEEWIAAGGHGVLHKGHLNETLENLRKIMSII